VSPRIKRNSMHNSLIFSAENCGPYSLCAFFMSKTNYDEDDDNDDDESWQQVTNGSKSQKTKITYIYGILLISDFQFLKENVLVQFWQTGQIVGSIRRHFWLKPMVGKLRIISVICIKRRIMWKSYKCSLLIHVGIFSCITYITYLQIMKHWTINYKNHRATYLISHHYWTCNVIFWQHF